MKTEPSVFSLEDLKNLPKQTDCWDGVRNYQARNMMRDNMCVNDRILFYHSSCKPPCVVGLARVAKEAYPDHSAWDPKSPYYDKRSTPQKPIWMMVDVRYEATFSRPLPLAELHQHPALGGMMLLQKGMRLSVQPVKQAEFEYIVQLAKG